MSNITQIKMPNNSVPYDILDVHALRKYHDLEINWEKQTDFIPAQGEIIVYDRETLANGLIMPNVVTDQNGNSLLSSGRTSPYTYERFKIGDGIKLVSNLPFFDDQLQQQINALQSQIGDVESLLAEL